MHPVPWQGRTTLFRGRTWRAAALKPVVAWTPTQSTSAARAPLIHANHQNGHAGIIRIQHYGTCGLTKRVKRFKVVTAASDSDPPPAPPPPPSAKPPPAILRPLLALWESLHGVTVFIASVLDRWYIKAVLFMTLFCVGLSLLIKACLVPYVNRSVLPFACEKAAELLEREVRIGELDWVSLGGLSGLHPLASISNVYVGPGVEEHSSLKAHEVVLSVDTVQTLLSKQITCKVHASGIELLLVQGSNFTWFGFPRDNDVYHEIGPAGIKPPDHPSYGKPSTHLPPGPSPLAASAAKPPTLTSYDSTHATSRPVSSSANTLTSPHTPYLAGPTTLPPIKLATSSRWQHYSTLPVASISSNIPGGGNNSNHSNSRTTPDNTDSSAVDNASKPTQPRTGEEHGPENDHTAMPSSLDADRVMDQQPAVGPSHGPSITQPDGIITTGSRQDHETHDDHHQLQHQHTNVPHLHDNIDDSLQPNHDALEVPQHDHAGGDETLMHASHPSVSSHPLVSSHSAQLHGLPAPAPDVDQVEPVASDDTPSTDTHSELNAQSVLSTDTAFPSSVPHTTVSTSSLPHITTSMSSLPDTATPFTSSPSNTTTPTTSHELQATVHGTHIPHTERTASGATPSSVNGSDSTSLTSSATSTRHGTSISVDSRQQAPPPPNTAAVPPPPPAGAAAAVEEPSAPPELRKGIRIFGRRLVAERALKQRHPEAKVAEGWQREQRDGAGVDQEYRRLIESKVTTLEESAVEVAESGKAVVQAEKPVEERKPSTPEATTKPQGFQAMVEDKVKSIAEIVSPVPKEVLPPLAIVTMGKYMVARVLESWQPPTVAVSRVSLSGGTLLAYMEGEATPRVVEDVEASCKFGRDYHWIDAEVSGRARARDPLLDKCTMISPKAKRHLRHVTAGAQVGKVRIFQNDELSHDLEAELKDQLCPQAATPPEPSQTGPRVEAGVKAEAVFSNVQVERRPLVSKNIGGKDGTPGPEGAPAVGGANPAWTASVQGALGDIVAPALEKEQKHIFLSTYKILDPTKLTPQQVVKLGWKTPSGTSKPAAGEGDHQEGGAASNGQLPVPAKGSGGDVKVRVTCRNIMVPDRWPDLLVSIKGDNLHGPLVERIMKLPIDIYEGRADGELRIKAFDEETWEFPQFYGKVHCKDVDLHFWDAPDDIHSATMDLLFEKDRMYLHGASGYFGAVPLTVTGDMDLNPDTGTYRLSASVTPVEVNALRASLGVRPIPFPCVGGVRGVLHCTGPLEFPLFSGTAVAVRPNADTLAKGEDSVALEALKTTSSAVAAYDKIPVVSASGVFTMDMSSKMFMLHSGHAQPVGGGQLIASGRMWVADEAEEDPRAVRMQGEGQGLDADLLLQHYLPPGVSLPSSIRMGAINVKGSIEGSHISPVVRARWDAPTSAITGSAMLSRPLVQASSSGPHFQAAASLTQSFPFFEKMKVANTQAEATLYGAPLITGCDLESSVAGLDLLQMTSGPAPTTRMSSGAPVRLKVAASTSLSVRLQDENEPLSFAGSIQLADVRLNQLSLARQLSGHLQLCPSALNITARGLRPDELLDVHISLPQTAEPQSRPNPDHMTAQQSQPPQDQTTAPTTLLNPMMEAPVLSAKTEQEQADISLAGPTAQDGHGAKNSVGEQKKLDDLQSGSAGEKAVKVEEKELGRVVGSGREGHAAADQSRAEVEQEKGQEQLRGAEISSQVAAVAQHEDGAGADAASTKGVTGTDTNEPTPPPSSDTQPPLTHQQVTAEAEGASTSSSGAPHREGPTEKGADGPSLVQDAPMQAVAALPVTEPMDSSFVLRRGPLLVSARVNSEMNCGALRLAGMKLDELELASLRGQVGELEIEVDLPKQSGHAHVYIDSPRYSGLQGVGFSSHVRWDGSVLRLEQAVLQQKHSRYEVQGEYILPPNTTFPDTALIAVGPTEGSEDGNDPSAESTGFWRVMLTVPQAELEEILPAARLLRRATSVQSSDYNTAKREFLTQMGTTSIEAPQLLPQVRALAADGQVSKEPEWDRSPSPHPPTASPTPKSVLPGLQDLKGRWSGSVQAVGGGRGATSVNFSVKGQNWKWGSFGLDQVVVAGTAHESDGVQLDELVLRSGEARLSVHGSLLSPKQDATIILHDFPAAMLHPLYRALPALQNAAPAVNALPKKSGNVGSMGPISAMSQRLEQTMGNLLGKLGGGNTDVASWAGSPINGQLELKGVLGGSSSAPEGHLKVRLYDGAIGAVRLARAEAEMGINSQQQLSLEVDLVPAESAGHLKMVGRMPLLPLSKATSAAAAPSQGPGDEDSMDLRVSVKDGGMSLVTSIFPDVCWVGGNAAIELSMRGSVASPQVQGSATLSKASITSPYLKYPVTNVGGTVKVQDSTLRAENLEARVGRQGHVRIRGDLPITPAALKTSDPPPSPGKKGAAVLDGLSVDINGLEVRIRNLFTGSVDAKLQLLQSLDNPRVAGSVRFSKGTAYLIPQGGAGSAAPINPEGGASERDMVAKAFAALKAGKLRSVMAEQPAQAAGGSPHKALPSAPPAPSFTNMYLDKLTVALGPELRAVFPLVINVGVSGEVELMGPADPTGIKVKGMFKLENGVINLVATQFNLDRDHPNTIAFVPERSLDPEIDVCLLSSDLRCLVQGSSSSWQDHVVLTHRGGGPGTPGEGERVDPEDIARIFEGRLAETLLAEDGQLAFSNLASSTFSTLLPKIETHGQLGKARWRLVSALPIPGLLSLEPSGDASNLLSTLTMGTEVEIQFGKSVQAAMAYKAREAEGSGTEWTLIYQISSKLRLQAHLKSHNPLPTILLQYSSEATTR